MFGWSDIQFGFLDCDVDYTVITVHLEWNMIFFAEEDGRIVADDIDRIRVHVIPAHVFRYVRRSVKKEFNYRPFYIPYVLLFLESLAEQ